MGPLRLKVVEILADEDNFHFAKSNSSQPLFRTLRRRKGQCDSISLTRELVLLWRVVITVRQQIYDCEACFQGNALERN